MDIFSKAVELQQDLLAARLKIQRLYIDKIDAQLEAFDKSK
ncbi:hypothetical protein [Siminovitchia fordii]|uniref:Uncharacterized protein n=1 Tax=Siminovitchia fordii TaxID=254759 RepID=A0ABQ4K9X9_9BACI|nr:hypothetical protein [Siminovitchia fordii]GIN22534.1 hypothetical protein J1TS3_36680 [Siminovitchia fordii]